MTALSMLAAHRGEVGLAPSPHIRLDPLLEGAIDIHTHPAPDSRERSIDAMDFARLVKESGMRGFVMRQHNDHTAGHAYLVRQAVSEVEVFGVLVLNRSMGGINVAAVERFAQVTGGWGRIVSMPTFDAPDIPVTRNGELLPEARAVLDALARTRTKDSNGHLVLATGHVTPAETLLLLQEARAIGVRHMVVTHPLGTMSIAQMRAAAEMGAFLEFVAARVLADDPDARLRESAKAIREVGTESVILSSDLGRPDLPLLHPRGLATFAAGLRRHGFSEAELAVMMKENPARLLGISEPVSP